MDFISESPDLAVIVTPTEIVSDVVEESGRAKNAMQSIFRRVGTLIGQPVGFRGRPDKQTLEMCQALGKEFAKTIS